MTITVADLGPNSASLTITNETMDTVRQAVSDWFTAHGWTAHDSFTDGNGYRIVVLKSLCVGGVAFKYVSIRIGTADIYILPAENWNAVTRTGTNPASMSPSASQTFSLVSSKLYLFASPRYIGLMVLVGTTYGDPTFVFEVKRENPSDLDEATGFPAFFGTTCSRATLHSGIHNSTSFPRTRNGTGNAASFYGGLRSRLNFTTGNGGPDGTGFIYPARTDTMLDVADTPICYPYVSNSHTNSSQFMGRVYGVKILPRDFGNQLDTVNIKCNAEGMTDVSGTDVSHFILANTAGRIAIPV